MELPKRLRLWGIGGVGMSALAQHLWHEGHELSGYDREASPQTKILSGLGIPIDFHPNPERLAAAEGVIYTPAIPADFPEWEAVKQRSLPTWRRAAALAQVLRPYQVLAVAGAHGKTSTSAILTWLLHALGESPTAFVGGIMRNFHNTYITGTGNWAVAEADEYDRAMILLKPAHAIIQSVEADHLEIYGSAEGVLEAYRTFAQQVKGLCVGPTRLPDLGRPLLRYQLSAYETREGQVCFRYEWEGKRREVCWHQLGRAYAENASAALTLLEALGLPFTELAQALQDFAGVHRRIELYSLPTGHLIVSDYAHHPTEIRTTLQALREAFPSKPLLVLFQPHLYSRTAFFAKQFGEALSLADRVYLFPIYAAREPSTGEVTHRLISTHIAAPVEEDLPLGAEMFSKLPSSPPAVIALLGAGDIYKWVEPLINYLANEA